jgi:iron complex transport system substrate-binding protein
MSGFNRSSHATTSRRRASQCGSSRLPTFRVSTRSNVTGSVCLACTVTATVTVVRIVSLLSSTTEIIGALGLTDDLLGVTFECDTPEGVRNGRAILVHGLDTVGMSAGEIDEAVRAAAAAGTPMYQLDEAAFAQCNPELVLTQDLCRVCALPAGDVADALDHLGCSATVVSHDPHTLDEVLVSIERIAEAAGVASRGTELVAGLRARLAAVAEAVAGRPRPRVFVLEWTDPPFLAGHWVPDLVTAAGGEAVLTKPGERSTPTTWEAIAATDPDVIVVAPCGFDLAGAVAQSHTVSGVLPTNAAVWAIDANACVVRPGPRLVDAVEHLAAILHGVGEANPMQITRVR